MLSHCGLIMSHWLCIIKQRVGKICLPVPHCVHFLPPTYFPCWYVWSQQGLVSHRSELYPCTSYSWFLGVLWHWTMSHLCPVVNVSGLGRSDWPCWDYWAGLNPFPFDLESATLRAWKQKTVYPPVLKLMSPSSIQILLSFNWFLYHSLISYMQY